MTVIVSIRGGAVIDVEAPPEMDVIIRDYDVDGTAPEMLEVDRDGEFYVEMVW